MSSDDVLPGLSVGGQVTRLDAEVSNGWLLGT